MTQHAVNLVLPGLDPDQIAVPCLFMRGGSSRGGFFMEEDLPPDPRDRAALLLACYGSPDARQIDGIGGVDPVTSKAAVVGRSSRADADLDYTFYQVGVDRPQISTGGNCGNMLAAVAGFGIIRGLIRPEEPETAVRVYTTNTGQVVTVRVQVAGGYPKVAGDASVPGVPGTGSLIAIDFGDCAGSVSGRLLPTGSPRDRIEVRGRMLEVSLVDAATSFVFVPAATLGARGTESPAEILANHELAADLEAVRGWAAMVLGFATSLEAARAVTPNIPRVIMVAPPRDYAGATGPVRAAEVDLCVRQMAMQRPHNTLAVTGAVCTAVAAQVPGSVVAELSTARNSRTLLGHPGGVLAVSAEVAITDGRFAVRSATVERTARLIMAGHVFAGRARVAEIRAMLES